MKTENKNRKSKVMKRAIRIIKAMKTIRLRVTSITIKTKNENEMKTKNNVQKTILRFAAVVISFVLISFTVSAQDFWKKLIAGSSFNAIALAMVDHSNEGSHSAELTSSTYDFSYVPEVDESLPLESWMLNDMYHGDAIPTVVNETEKALEIEPWMLNEKLFDGSSSEEELKLEDWMMSNTVWK
jgi:hypothetical protein